jgi:hypothetical protein
MVSFYEVDKMFLFGLFLFLISNLFIRASTGTVLEATETVTGFPPASMLMVSM